MRLFPKAAGKGGGVRGLRFSRGLFVCSESIIEFLRMYVELKVIPQYCIVHPYCARFLASLARAHSARTLTTWRFLYETKLAREIKGHFLLNEHGDLSFFLHKFDEIIIFFELNEF